VSFSGLWIMGWAEEGGEMNDTIRYDMDFVDNKRTVRYIGLVMGMFNRVK
jgi:hypothetical protein